ncbi:MAG: RNA methyltransferase [Pseudomonadota bacterium]
MEKEAGKTQPEETAENAAQADRDRARRLSGLKNVRVILVEPSHPGNIGGAARAMKTMGLHDLALVNPTRFPDPQAEWRAAGAQDVLETVEVFDSLEAAIADRQWIIGTSTRVRRIPWPLKQAEEAAAALIERLPEQKLAILFGRETSGLTNEELQKCHCHLVIPANPEYPSLNLAMAVQVVCYELFRQLENSSLDPREWDRAPATAEELEALIEHFESVLVAAEFLDPANPGQTMTRLRRLLTRVTPDETEVQMLRGMLKQLSK